jgi:large subunit ribosomal protein L22
MSKYNYAMKYEEPNSSKAVGVSLSISTKMAVEICSYIKGMDVNKAIKYLEDVAEQRKALPLKRFNRDIGHRPGIGPGRYPKKASLSIIKVIKNAKSNALYKGLDSENMVIKYCRAQKAAQNYHYGRLRGRKVKRCHVEVILEEAPKKSKESVKKIKPEEKIKDASETKKNINVQESKKSIKDIKDSKDTKDSKDDSKKDNKEQK